MHLRVRRGGGGGRGGVSGEQVVVGERGKQHRLSRFWSSGFLDFGHILQTLQIFSSSARAFTNVASSCIIFVFFIRWFF